MVDSVVTVRGVVQEGEEDHAHSGVGVVDLEVVRGNTKEEVAVIEGMTRGNLKMCKYVMFVCVCV